jgi:hypothetical protein
MGKVKEFIQDVEAILLIMYTKIGMDRPINHDEILLFVADDVQETADPVNWSDSDVAIAFRRWIESKATVIGEDTGLKDQCSNGLYVGNVLNTEEESNDPRNFSDIEIEEWKEKWGQTHSGITAELGYPRSHAESDELLIDEYFWIEKDKRWYNRSASMFTDREQAIADYLYALSTYQNLNNEKEVG